MNSPIGVSVLEGLCHLYWQIHILKNFFVEVCWNCPSCGRILITYIKLINAWNPLKDSSLKSPLRIDCVWKKLLNKKNYDHSWFFATRFMKKEVKSIKKKITDLYFEQIINCIKFAAQNIVPPPPQPKKKKTEKSTVIFRNEYNTFSLRRSPIIISVSA